MLIRVDDHALVDDLCVHFRRSGFTAERVGGGMVEVERPDATSARARTTRGSDAPARVEGGQPRRDCRAGGLASLFRFDEPPPVRSTLRPVPADESAHRQTARRQSRTNRSRPPTHRSDLAHAHPRGSALSPLGAGCQSALAALLKQSYLGFKRRPGGAARGRITTSSDFRRSSNSSFEALIFGSTSGIEGGR